MTDSPLQRMRDDLLERRIAAYQLALKGAKTMEERRQAWELLQAAVAKRSAAQVARMEAEKGRK